MVRILNLSLHPQPQPQPQPPDTGSRVSITTMTLEGASPPRTSSWYADPGSRMRCKWLGQWLWVLPAMKKPLPQQALKKHRSHRDESQSFKVLMSTNGLDLSFEKKRMVTGAMGAMVQHATSGDLVSSTTVSVAELSDVP